jgi:hypothetical protein
LLSLFVASQSGSSILCWREKIRQVENHGKLVLKPALAKVGFPKADTAVQV